MCRQLHVVWSCGHSIDTFLPCEHATLAPRASSSGSEPSPYFHDGLTYVPCANMRSQTTPNWADIPFCSHKECVPNYWTCCQCRHIAGFGCKNGDNDGVKRPSSHRMMKRLAPSLSASRAELQLQLGDVCGDDMEEGQRAGFLDDPSTGPVPCSAVACNRHASEAQANHVAIPREELLANLAEMADTVPPLPSEGHYRGDTDCGHMRCKECISWRRCPCLCLCVNIIPATRRGCKNCVKSNCDAVSYLDLRGYLDNHVVPRPQPPQSQSSQLPQ